MDRHISRVKEIDVAAVEGNKTIAPGVDRRAVERCKAALEKTGVMHTPVVGVAEGGRRLLLYGQCELTALRELHVKKMDAIEVGVADGRGASAKLSLLLMSLWERPGALCEGLLIQEAVGSGVPRSEIQAMLGRSASWVSNRVSLVTRLDGNVYGMVKSGLLDPRSAQEIARLPKEAQFAFAEAAVRECLPKSAIESLVAGYNDGGCPGAVKAQIISDPRAALKRMADKRRSVKHEGGAAQHAIGGCLMSLRAQITELRGMLACRPPSEAMECAAPLGELAADLSALHTAVRKSFSPGKMGAEKNAG